MYSAISVTNVFVTCRVPIPSSSSDPSPSESVSLPLSSPSPSSGSSPPKLKPPRPKGDRGDSSEAEAEDDPKLQRCGSGIEKSSSLGSGVAPVVGVVAASCRSPAPRDAPKVKLLTTESRSRVDPGVDIALRSRADPIFDAGWDEHVDWRRKLSMLFG